MYQVEVKNACRCFLRSGMVEKQRFELKEDAQEEAKQMLQEMQKSFCKKHSFVLTERFGDCTITITNA